MNSEPRAVQFINIENSGKCILTKEGEEIISNIKDNVAVICVAGLYRTGKSYLINRLLGRQSGFDVGPTTNSCTKGLWIWSEPIFLEEKKMSVILMDTEGLGSAFEDRNESIDMVIFCLSMLLSSYFIYNSMKNIDETAIENLALVINFAKKVQGKFKEVESYVNNFPSFLWVIRDFALDLIDVNGKTITPATYLENALTVFEGDSEHNRRKNEIRNLLKMFFRDRDCATLPRPVSEEKKLRYIDKISEKEIRPEFMRTMNELVSKVFFNLKPKVVQGSYLNGKMFLDLSRMYINSINSDSLPDVKTSWKIVVDSQFQSIYDKSVKYYVDSMIGLDFKAISKVEELIKYHYSFKEKSFDFLKEVATINIPNNFFMDFQKNLEKELNKQFSDFTIKWNELSAKNCQTVGDQLIKEYNDSKEDKNNKIDILTTLEILEDIIKFIDDSVLNNRKYEILLPRMINYFIDNIKYSYKEIKTSYDDQIKNLKQEKDVLQSVLDQTKELFNKNKEQLENEVKSYKEQLLQQRLDFESKVDDKSNIIKKIEFQNKQTIEELKYKLNEANSLFENYKIQYNGSDKKGKHNVDGGMLEEKLNFLTNKIDDYKEILVRNEIEKAKLHLKLEMSSKIEEIEKEFNKKLLLAKKASENMIIKLKTQFNKENASLKETIKYLYDEISDYKSQVNSQEYKIDLYKEKIITYEKERKSQTDHAELLRILTQKLNNFLSNR